MCLLSNTVLLLPSLTPPKLGDGGLNRAVLMPPYIYILQNTLDIDRILVRDIKFYASTIVLEINFLANYKLTVE
jgi:hypothetical protein